jgi:hypothetical protein
MLTAPITVNFGTLEDFLEEIEGDLRDKKTIHGIRVTTNFAMRSGGGTIGEETTVWLVVTACTSEGQGRFAPLQLAVWSWRLVRFAEIHGAQASNWSQAEANTLAGKAVEAVRQAIEQRTGLRPRKGMYCLADSAWLTIMGGTNLVDLGALYSAVKPPVEEGREA